MTDPEDCGKFAEAIAAAGWSPGRRVATDAVAAAWRAQGYAVSAAGLEFVAGFDGIRFAYPRAYPPGTLDTYSCTLDAVDATARFHEGRVREYEERVSEALSPIGFAATLHLALTVSESGRIYGGYDNYLTCFGDTAYEALCRVFNGRRGTKIA